MNHSEIVSFLWGVADLLRDDFRRSKYQDVILPLTVLRRIDCVLEDTKAAVLARNAEFKGKLDNLDDLLQKHVRLRLLQHVPVRLREADAGRAEPGEEPAELRGGLQPEHA